MNKLSVCIASVVAIVLPILLSLGGLVLRAEAANDATTAPTAPTQGGQEKMVPKGQESGVDIPARPLPVPGAAIHENSPQTPNETTNDTTNQTSPTGKPPADVPASSGRTVGRYIDDTTITARIKSRLATDSSVHARAVKVQTDRGMVQLSGFVDSEQEKSTAGDVARQVPGVVDVHNDIIVRAGGGNH